MEITSRWVDKLGIRHEGIGVIAEAAEILPLREGIVATLGAVTGTRERADGKLHGSAVVEIAVVVKVELRRRCVVTTVAHVRPDEDGRPLVAVDRKGVVHDVAAERDVLWVVRKVQGVLRRHVEPTHAVHRVVFEQLVRLVGEAT